MKYGIVLPNGDARIAANFAREAEKAGWDGFFVWEPVWGIDAWVCMTAAAMLTERIRLGTMLTPLSRMRPWKLASETATLDNLSNGRVILAAGLGAIDTGFTEFGEVTDRKMHAELLDEGLDILTGLWRGQPFNYDGKHYKIKETKFHPPPLQKPRIPIWVVGAWPSKKSMRRAIRWDGILPQKMSKKWIQQAQRFNRAIPIKLDESSSDITPADIEAMKRFIDRRRYQKAPYDIVREGKTPSDDREKGAFIVHSWAEVGVTWWLEAMWDDPSPDHVLARIKQGPPRTE